MQQAYGVQETVLGIYAISETRLDRDNMMQASLFGITFDYVKASC